MADADVDLSELFSGNADEDDDMFYIDIQTVQKVLDEDDDCYFQEVGFLLCQKQRLKFRMLSLCKVSLKTESVIEHMPNEVSCDRRIEASVQWQR